jgi:hypothetical protein
MKSTELMLGVATDYTDTPGPRYRWQGKYSGEDFLELLLRPKFLDAESKNIILVVDLDGVEGYGSSFLEESFGGLTRAFGSERVQKTLKISSEDELLILEIEDYIKGMYDKNEMA